MERLIKRLLFFAAYCTVLIPGTFAQTVTLHYDRTKPQTVYAAHRLEKALREKRYVLKDGQTDYRITLAVNPGEPGLEAFSVASGKGKLTITGSDERGLLYGCLSLSEYIRNGVPLKTIRARREQARLPFRAIKFNLPWDAYREGYAMELHQETCRDLRFWEAFLDMMAQNRFNVLTLWNLHPFPYMIRPKNFPEASPFSDQELATWQTLYRGIFRMAKERGIDTYLINWNIFVSPEFAKAHHVAVENPEDRIHLGVGDTSAIIKRYTRESVTQVLEEYPDLTGLGFTHGEAMGGMTPQGRQDWFGETFLEGIRQAKRKTKLIHRVPLEANTKVGGSTSVDTEQLTRKAMEELDFLDGPIWAEIKFNWSHAFSSPKLIKVHGGKLNDTYFKPAPKNYKIAWMARNEDFFCLRWGVPAFIREHVRTNSQPYVGGYFVGSEGYIPARDYFTKPGLSVDWNYAFERQWLFYKLWGRLLYDPATPDAVFTSEFTRRYGRAAEPLLEASALVGMTPIRLACSFDFTWDFTLYGEGFMSIRNRVMEYISIDRQISQPTADTTYVSVTDYVRKGPGGAAFGRDKITPIRLADLLEQDCRKALNLIKPINATSLATLSHEVADIKAWANLGLYFAQKLRGAVDLENYRRKGGEEHKQQAIQHLERALGYWDEVVRITHPLYADMPLAAYSYPKDGKRVITDTVRRFHWEKLRPDVANDIDIAKRATVLSAK